MKINIHPMHHKKCPFTRPQRHIAFTCWGSSSLVFSIKVEKEVDDYYNWAYENPDEKSIREMEEYLKRQYEDDDEDE